MSENECDITSYFERGVNIINKSTFTVAFVTQILKENKRIELLPLKGAQDVMKYE
jgi:hypothetical protein